MRIRHTKQHYKRRLARDFVTAFMVFFSVALLLTGNQPWRASFTDRVAYHSKIAVHSTIEVMNFDHSVFSAPIYHRPTDWPVFESPPMLVGILLLTTLFAAFATFNLAAYRHLRCVSVSPHCSSSKRK